MAPCHHVSTMPLIWHPRIRPGILYPHDLAWLGGASCINCKSCSQQGPQMASSQDLLKGGSKGDPKGGPKGGPKDGTNSGTKDRTFFGTFFGTFFVSPIVGPASGGVREGGRGGPGGVVWGCEKKAKSRSLSTEFVHPFGCTNFVPRGESSRHFAMSWWPTTRFGCYFGPSNVLAQGKSYTTKKKHLSCCLQHCSENTRNLRALEVATHRSCHVCSRASRCYQCRCSGPGAEQK